MCGIAGIFGSVREGRRIVAAMTARLAHRGPDGDGLASGRHHVLGHRRLAIIDRAGGAQPMHMADGRYVLTYNGEIYNHQELRAELERLGWRMRTRSDTEVLLAALVEWGADVLPKLNGMFAFAFCDTLTGDWLIARDRFGIKPLYFAETTDAVVFASEIKAMFEHPDIAREIDVQGLETYVTFQFTFDDVTLFKGIRKVRPGQYMRGRGGRILAKEVYWLPNCAIDDRLRPEAFADQLRWLVEDSVRLQLCADVPLGTHLSGGLDSTAVAILVGKALGKPFAAFCGRFDEGPAFDESPHARLAAAAAGATLHEIVPTPEDFIAMMPAVIWHMDEPAAGPGVFPQYLVSRRAAEHVKVVLGGQGGDEVFAGYARYLLAYLEQALKGAIQGTQEEGQHIVLLSSIVPNLRVLDSYTPLMRSFWSDGLFGSMESRYMKLIDRGSLLGGLLADDVRSHFDRERLEEQYRAVFNDPRTPSYLNKMSLFDLRTLLPALLHVEDRVSMAAGLESRVPLLDHRIIELVLRAPPAVKFAGGRLKHLFRTAMENDIPQPILNRTDKMGFPVPLAQWMQREPLRSFVYDTMTSRASRERGLFKTTEIGRLLDGETVAGREIWGALCLELWNCAFFDAPLPKVVSQATDAPL